MPSASSAKPFNSLKAAMSCSPRLCEALAGMRRFSTSTGRGLYPSRPIKHDLAPVTVDCILKCQRIAVMHKAVSHARAPQRRCPQLGRRFLPTILNDAVSGSDVMQQKVAERMNDLVPERLWHGQSAAVDQRVRRGRHNGAHVTNAAANGFKHVRPLLSVRSDGNRQIPRRCLRGAQKTSKSVDVVSRIIGYAPLAERGNINAK